MDFEPVPQELPRARQDPPEQPGVSTAPRQREASFSDAVILLIVFLACQVVLGLAATLVTGASRGSVNSLVVACIEAGSLAALIPLVRRRLGHWITDYVRYAPVPGPRRSSAVRQCCPA